MRKFPSAVEDIPVLEMEEVGRAEPVTEAIEPPESPESPELPPVTRKLRNRIGSRNNNSQKILTQNLYLIVSWLVRRRRVK